mmetsp:Transcript_30109/g.96867  ORF Transcript_30109/g.96867 Transcript_30109/m.96867 type:complete len:170 (-) Transcript_30109:1020-1529(-)
MAKPWEELHIQIESDKEYNDAISYKGLTCLEVHAGWCGPCTAAIPTLKKLHWDMVEEKSAAVQFVVANSDNIQALQEFKERSKPLFMMFRKGQKLTTIEGVNTYALRVKRLLHVQVFNAFIYTDNWFFQSNLWRRMLRLNPTLHLKSDALGLVSSYSRFFVLELDRYGR